MPAYVVTICHVFHDTLYLFRFLCDVFCLGRCTQPMYYSEGTERGSETVPEGSIVWPLTKTFCNFVEFYIKYTVALWNFLTWIPLFLYQIYTLMQNPLTQDYWILNLTVKGILLTIKNHRSSNTVFMTDKVSCSMSRHFQPIATCIW